MSILKLNQVSLNYANNNKPALDCIDYQIHRGDFIILLGSNGSGKSTLLKLLHRQQSPTSGHIHFLGKPIAESSSKAFSRQVIQLTQNCADALFTSLTLFENYLLVRDYLHFSKKTAYVEREFLKTYLHDYNPNLSDKLDVTINQLSGGEKQAFALALCLLKPPALLLLDEHTSALDPNTSNQIMRLTQKMITHHHITCVLTTHDLDIALNYGNRILMLQDGKIHRTYNHAEKAALSKPALIASYSDRRAVMGSNLEASLAG